MSLLTKVGHIHLHSFPTRRSSDLKGSAVVLNASINAHLGMPGTTVYGATKAAVVNMAKTLSADLLEKGIRSEEHTSELQSLRHLVCRLLLEKKNNNREHDVRQKHI